MKPKLQLHERLANLYNQFEDPELARCAIEAKAMRDELIRTRWDRAREWTLLTLIVMYALHTTYPWVISWLQK